MEANDVVEFLSALVCGHSDEAEDFINEIRSVRTYQEAGVLTRDQGLLVQMNDGSEMQITVIRSK